MRYKAGSLDCSSLPLGRLWRPKDRVAARRQGTFRERFRGLQPPGLSAQRRSSASAIPEMRPLRPTTHWRSGKPAIFSALVLKPKPLRECHRLAGVGEGKGNLTGDQRADAADSRL